MTKIDWLQSVAHISAQSAAIFFLSMMALLFFVIRHDIKKEQKENEK